MSHTVWVIVGGRWTIGGHIKSKFLKILNFLELVKFSDSRCDNNLKNEVLKRKGANVC